MIWKDRCFGFTERIIKDALKEKDSVVLVANNTTRKLVYRRICEYLGIENNMKNINKIKDKVIIPFSEDVHGRNFKHIFVDNSCTEEDVHACLCNLSKTDEIKLSGFVTVLY